MTEVTRVPILPIKKGSIPKLWLGVAVAALAGAGLAVAAMPSAVQVSVTEAGTGASPTMEDVVLVSYVGKLDDGTVFEKSEHAALPLGSMIPGFAEGLMKMKKGGKYTMVIPGDKAYGANPPPQSKIPANANLTFDIELVDFMSRADFESRMQAMQQMQQMMKDQGGEAAGQ
ncbi:MAG: FKBP-type peptidyl-prolyl cis-trans isomerase [Novosphingobium sp.]|nr:FKBP-type peptidyl-prolyl cis-trans isomerase [Novosphingobium sp.]